ncbi:MAG: DEAD/DEAH box helicase [Candidatus Heimdallarchaeota archaeon]|nr:MAG: DEAD/DEAH box helicase [Candidatus Heimdallarchaeota archaeon]
MEIEEFLFNMENHSSYRQQMIFKTAIPAKSAKYGNLDFKLEPELTDWLEQKQLKLYSHQAEALNAIHKGKNVVITTPTASGKTLIFSLSVANAIARKRAVTALFLYPTKALANDQLKKLEELNEVLNGRLRPYIYDGDTPSRQRPQIRNFAHAVISNPYAFHQYLDWHQKWDRFFRNLRFIVIDEAHQYRGVFGSNVSQLIRRLNRIINHYGALPQYILSSATINNPTDFITKLIGKPVEVIKDDGAEYGIKHLILWNPPYINRYKLKKRSPHQETRDLLVQYLKADYQTLCFTLSRRMAELVSMWVKQDLKHHKLDYEQVMSYRAGYRPLERREIENKLRNREIQAVVSTNALEVGIDIGNLDAVLLSGFPGTIISTWQQMGRVGRTLRPSLATLVLFEDPLQQFLGKHPDYFLEKNPENAIIDLHNPYILKGHILCAAAELPLTLNEIQQIWGDQGKIIAQELRQEELVKIVPAGLTSSSPKRPASVISLNTAFTDIIEVLIQGSLLETMSIPQAYREAHDGAILIHQGETYLVEKLDLKRKKAIASPIEVDYYTDALSTSEVTVLETLLSKDIGFPLFFGEVKVTEEYHSFRKKTYDEVLEILPLNLPSLTFITKALWIEIPDEIVNRIQHDALDFPGGIHAMEHATIALSPMYAMCDRWDIGGTSYPCFPVDGKAKVFIYDGFPGGIGISEQLFKKCDSLLKNVLDHVKECECKEGCPSCVQSPKCGNENFPLDKSVAILMLEELLKK